MGSITLEKLYDNYNTLSDSKDKIAEHSKEYLEAVEATKGGEKEKKLAAQILSKFFKHFPSQQCQAIEAVFDLCEDNDTSIRIAAMKALPQFCKDTKEYVSKIADILAQLLQLDDPQEYNIASSSLLQVLKANPLTSVRSIFKVVQTTDSEVREKCLKFFTTKVKTLDKSIINTEVEDVIITECKKLLKDCSSDEFILLIQFLTSTKLGNSFTGQQELVEIATHKVKLDEPFVPFDEDGNNTDKLLVCLKFIRRFFSAKVESTKFVTYICDQVLPQWDKIAEQENGEKLQLGIARELADLSTHCGKLDNPSLYVVQIFQKLKDYMPSPPENTDILSVPLLDFTIVECLLYAFHKLARQCPDFLTHDPLVLKDVRARLMYFSRAAQACVKSLNENKSKETLSEEEKLQRQCAPKVLNNINTLVKDLFYQPPMYKCSVTLSFKQTLPKVNAVEKTLSSPTKRHIPITFESNGSSNSKSMRPMRGSDGMKLYTPPSGKFSNNFNSYGRPRGRNMRGSRGRGGGRTWRN